MANQSFSPPQEHQHGQGGGNRGTPAPQASGGTMSTIAKGAENVASSAVEAVGQAWDSTRSGVEQAASSVANVAGDAWDETRTFLRRYPLATLAGGFVLG